MNILLVSCEKYIEINIFVRNDSNIVKRPFETNIQDVVDFGLFQDNVLLNT